MCSQNMQCIHRNSPTQSLGVDFSPTASREAVCAVGAFETAHEGGQGRDIRAVVGEEEAIEHSPQEQHDHQYHEHQW